MKIDINIDFKPHKTAELDRIAKGLRNHYESINLLEEYVDSHRERIERLEEAIARLGAKAEEE